MTRFPYDQFAKDYLEELLSPLGEVQAPREVRGEVRQIDVWFSPIVTPSAADIEALGLLGRLTQVPSLFEPFRNAATTEEICNCLLKFLEIRGEIVREAHRNREPLKENTLPRLWILSPTVSAAMVEGFSVMLDEENWVRGVYFFGARLRTAIIAIHQLPRTPETLWLRILGRGKVQQQAIDELQALPRNHPLRSNALRLLTNLKANLQQSEDLEKEERNLVMKLSPLYVQWREEALQEGRQEGNRAIIENAFRVRFGGLDDRLSAIIEPMLELPSEEFMPLLLQLSREELLARFGMSDL